MKNKIYISFENNSYTGGPATFMENLKSYIDKREFYYSNSPDNAKLIFFPIEYDLNIIKNIKQKKGKVIQRLDGVYYPQKHGNKHIEINKNMKSIYQNYSDFIIFQSEYSIKQCFTMLGEKKKTRI